MTTIQIEDLLSGATTGNYKKKVGSQFGSLWGFDGLMVAEATPEEYAAFGASSKVKLCHGEPVTWLEREWAPILTYNGQTLAQINIHTEYDDTTFTKVYDWLLVKLGEGKEINLSDDSEIAVLHRIEWNRLGGVVTLVHTPTFIQVSITPPVKSIPSVGCLSMLFVFVGGISLIALFIASFAQH